jgi:GDP-D-mannose 3',5'-epimerase
MIGSNLALRLADEGNNVYVVDNFSRGTRQNLLEKDHKTLLVDGNIIEGDLRDPNTFSRLPGPFDEIYHLADVVAGIGYVFKNQLAIFRDNILINSNTIDYARKTSPELFLYVGTACSFPAHLQKTRTSRGLVESDQYPAAPESSYGWSKLMGEYETFLLNSDCGIPVSVLSLHNVYGTPCDISPARSQAIPSLIRKAIESTGSIEVWGSGNQSRAFIHVRDVIDAIILARDKGRGKGLIQIGPDFSLTIREIAEIIVKISGKDLRLSFDTSRPEGDFSRHADFSKAKSVLGWNPKVDITSGIMDMYTWILDRIDSQPS